MPKRPNMGGLPASLLASANGRGPVDEVHVDDVEVVDVVDRVACSRELPPPSEPMRVAHEFVAERYTGPDDELFLRHWRGGWWRWRRSRWVELEDPRPPGHAYRLHRARHLPRVDKQGRDTQAMGPNRYKIRRPSRRAGRDLLPARGGAAAGMDRRVNTPKGVIVACANGLLYVATRTCSPTTHRFFDQTAVPFDFDAKALEPVRGGWGSSTSSGPATPDADRRSSGFLGYVSRAGSTSRRSFVVGPTRGGKGAIARVFGQLVGRENVAGPDAVQPRQRLRARPLAGKSLAVIPTPGSTAGRRAPWSSGFSRSPAKTPSR